MVNIFFVKATIDIYDEINNGHLVISKGKTYKVRLLKDETEIIDNDKYEIFGRALYFPKTDWGWFLLYIRDNETIDVALNNYGLELL